MAARPRRYGDRELIEAAARAIESRGDGSWSLGDVGSATGMSPAALVKRFGSKLGLLRAVAARWVEELPAYSPSTDPLQVVRAWVDEWARDVSDPATARGNLTMLFDEIFNPECRQILIEGHLRQAAYLADALADAHARGLLPTGHRARPPTSGSTSSPAPRYGCTQRSGGCAKARPRPHSGKPQKDWTVTTTASR